MDFRSRIANLSEKKRQLLLRKTKDLLKGTAPDDQSEKKYLDSNNKKLNATVHSRSTYLDAYVVTEPGKDLSAEILRKFLQKSLPNYMIPNRFFWGESIPKNSNGKVDLKALFDHTKDSYTKATQEFAAPRNKIEESLARIWSEFLNVKQVGIHDNFFELGGNSILSIQIVSKAKREKLQFSINQLFENQTIAELATLIHGENFPQVEQRAVNGEVPLTSNQHWFFNQKLANHYDWNQAILLDINGPIDVPKLERALGHLLVHHDALRFSFRGDGNTWKQFNNKSSTDKRIIHVHLSKWDESEQFADIKKTTAELQSSLSLAKGDLLRFAIFTNPTHKLNRLVILIHYLIADSKSCKILIEDLETVYWILINESEDPWLPKTQSYKRWAECCNSYADSKMIRKELDYWLAVHQNSANKIPKDSNDSDHEFDLNRHVISSLLSKEETKLLSKEIPVTLNTPLIDLLLTALSLTFSEWVTSNTLLVDLELQNREETFDGMDLSRTIGSFRTIFPFALTLGKMKNLENALKMTKEQLHTIPHASLGYGFLRYLSQNKDISSLLSNLPNPKILFKDVARMDQYVLDSKLFKLAEMRLIKGQDIQASQNYLIEITPVIFKEKLEISWSYRPSIHFEKTIKNLSDRFFESIKKLLEYCTSHDIKGFTPSDFPEADLNQTELDALLSELDESDL